MLYERWRQIALVSQERIALRDLGSGAAWSFGELAHRIENEPLVREPVAFPQGNSAEFIFSVLRAWRSNQLVCPLESGQAPPSLSGSFPLDVRHLKATSATTGAQRLVAFTAQQLIADAENIVTTMGLKAAWPNVGVISLAHSYG